jgi:hypothetical protein
MSTRIATTVSFDGRERAVFKRAGDWWPESGRGTSDRAVIDLAASGGPVQYQQLVVLLNALHAASDSYRDEIDRTPAHPLASVWETKTLPALLEALRIVISLVAMDELMFGTTEYELCGA